MIYSKRGPSAPFAERPLSRAEANSRIIINHAVGSAPRAIFEVAAAPMRFRVGTQFAQVEHADGGGLEKMNSKEGTYG